MPKNENMKILLNRTVSFLAGGLVVFAVMSFTVVNDAKKVNTDLAAELDLSKFEAGRLLADAKQQFTLKEFGKAKSSLTMLFDKQPGSAESAEGKTLFATIASAESAMNAKWEEASVGIQKKWVGDKASELRAEADKSRSELETGMNDTLSREWEKAKEQVRNDWEKKVQL